MATILVVDDEPAIRSFLSGALATEGHDVDEAGNGLEAMKKLAERSYHVLLTDLRMPEMDGIALLEGGREARAVQRGSARADGAFVPVNCAALSEQLLESELFGHERGAFTGAVARKRGR